MSTHYQVLEVGEDAKLIDIKKAYRRLALRYHPDRNDGTVDATEKFKRISEAYTVLSNGDTRRSYDLSLKYPTTQQSTAAAAKTARSRRDPFKQFDDLFKHDQFFSSAFDDLNDEFVQRFSSDQQAREDVEEEGKCAGVPRTFLCGAGGLDDYPCGKGEKKTNAPVKKKVGWGQWILNSLGIEFEVTTLEHKSDGSVLTKKYHAQRTGTYTDRQSRTYTDGDGNQVTVVSMEKNGNKIEDKFIAGKLLERRVNSVLEPLTEHQVQAAESELEVQAAESELDLD
mmetsp:Transcript_27035/g.60762  ORF Transcript_27035/g.60762 Transcript_27035/m.60762 type:complete len:283 (+) Transcript_27035:424-1272(+)